MYDRTSTRGGRWLEFISGERRIGRRRTTTGKIYRSFAFDTPPPSTTLSRRLFWCSGVSSRMPCGFGFSSGTHNN